MPPIVWRGGFHVDSPLASQTLSQTSFTPLQSLLPVPPAVQGLGASHSCRHPFLTQVLAGIHPTGKFHKLFLHFLKSIHLPPTGTLLPGTRKHPSALPTRACQCSSPMFTLSRATAPNSSKTPKQSLLGRST